MRKRIVTVSTLIITILLISLMSLTAFADGPDFDYEIGAGQTAVLTKYIGESDVAVIPESIDGFTVTAVSGGAFSGVTHITSVTVPSSVVTIDPSAFDGCTVDEMLGFSSSAAEQFANEHGIRFICLDKDGWIDEDDGTRYYDSGVFRVGFSVIDENTYYFDENGYMTVGLTEIDSKKYLFEPSGKMRTGWRMLVDRWYYFAESGEMVTGWLSLEGKTYYFEEDGKLVTGWKKIDGDMFYFAPMCAKGIDVSTFQKNVDWNKVKNDGYEFAIIRGGYGKKSEQKDAQFENNYKNAKAVGMPIGVYHYSYAKTVADAIKEADFCLSYLKGKQFEYPVAFDIEDPSVANLSKAQLTEIAKAFCSRLREKGYYVVIYSSKSWLTDKIDMKQLSEYDVWLAQYNSEVTYKGEYTLWQYTSAGSVKGVDGNVDLDYSYKDYPTIIKLNRLNGFTEDFSESLEYINRSGEMKTGWQKLQTDWYFLGSDGRMQIGWLQSPGNKKWYYLAENGKMLTGWVKTPENGKWYYLGTDGARQTGWVKSPGNKKWYFLDSDGVMLTGWVKSPGNKKWYLLGPDGAMLTGWQQSPGNKKMYYLGTDGAMQTGWKKINGKWYYLGTDGAMQTGWVKSPGNKKWYYLGTDGAMQTGWVKSPGNKKWYYLGTDGAMQTGWVKSPGNKKWYYLGTDGAMQTGWVQSPGNKKWYYLGTDGAMVTNCSKKIGNKTYKFASNGVCLNH